MPVYRAIWVDDAWPEDAWLSETRDKIIMGLEDCKLTVKWECTPNASDAYADLDAASSDCRLAILDCRFEGQKHDWISLLRICRRRGIPYIVITDYLTEILNDIDFDQHDRLLLDAFKKGDLTCQDDVRELVVRFFRSPPIRILHISDFHYDSSLEKDGAIEQDKLWESALRKIESENKLAPFDFLALTGDFANRRPTRDLLHIRKCIKQLVGVTVGDNGLDRLLVVPGNHDIVWDNFEDKILSEDAWQSYLDFYHSIYSGDSSIMKELSAWDYENRILSQRPSRDELAWYRWFGGLSVGVVGISTTSEEKGLQGVGEVSEQQQLMLKNKWEETPRVHGELRIALMHHNIFGVLSKSRFDDKTTVARSGDAMLSLMRANCNIVLCGHTHVTNLISCSAARRHASNELSTTGRLVSVSPGTFGGVHGSLQQPRSMLVLEIGIAHAETGRRSLTVRSLIYDSSEHQWYEPENNYTESIFQI